MDKELLEKFSVLRKQSAIGSIVLFANAVRKNAYNFLYALIPAFQGNFKIALILFIVGLSLVAIYSYLDYYYFTYRFDFDKSQFLINKGILKKTKLSIPFEKIQQININQSVIHRLFNIYEIQMDTAGSKDTEVDIKAVSKQISEDIKSISEIIKQKTVNVKTEEVEIIDDKSFQINFKTLIKIGLTSRFFQTLGLIFGSLAVVVQFLSDFEIEYSSTIGEFFENINYTPLIILVVLFYSILIVLAVNIINTLFKFFGYKATKKSNNLEIKYGLLSTKSFILSPSKVQQYIFSQNWIQKKLDIQNVIINQASSSEIKSFDKRSNINVPGCSQDQANELFEFIYDSKNDDEIELKPNIRKPIVNTSIFGFVPVLVFVLCNMSLDIMNTSYMLISSLFFLLIVLFINFRLFKNNSLFVSKDFIRVKSGIWDIKNKIIETYKVQSIIIYQPVWYKKYNLGSLALLTAGGLVHVGVFNYKDLQLISNNVAYRVENSNKGWM